MKHTILILLLSLPLFAGAQNTFAPPGSEWYHSQLFGVYHCYYAGDTVINNIASRIIIRKALTRDPYYSQGLHVDDQSTIYIYDNTDTVFIYNRFFHRFTPLYVFNVNDGDTIHLPIIPIDYGQLNIAYPDSTFKLVVDSVRNELYDTATLKTIYVHAIGNPDSGYVLDYGTGYAVRIGGLSTGLVPTGSPAAIPLTESLQPATGLKCYNDPTTSIKLTMDICGIPAVAVPELSKTGQVKCSPNPTHDILHITMAGTIGDINITNTMGQCVYSRSFSSREAAINLAGLAPGIYYLRLDDGSVQKLIKE